MEKRYNLLYMPARKDEPDPSLFGATLEEVERYLKSRLCGTCRTDLDRGYYEVFELDDFEELKPLSADHNVPIDSIWDTPCAAEWLLEEVESKGSRV